MDLLFIKFSIPGFSIVPYYYTRSDKVRKLMLLNRLIFPFWCWWSKNWWYQWREVCEYKYKEEKVSCAK